MSNVSSKKIIKAMVKATPGLEVISRPGGSHLKLFLHGRLAGIVPRTLAKESLSPNLASQLRRAGVKGI
jgi:hypothetical protein